jgi:hypothetical protein
MWKSKDLSDNCALPLVRFADTLTTTQNSLQQNLREIRFNQVPKTLQDSLMMARYLEFNYIWIDCLCIVQDDLEDWNREAVCMAEIYSNAALTIAASGSSDGSDGFLSSCNMAPWTPVCFEDTDGSFELILTPCSSKRQGYGPLPARLLAI